MPRVLIAKSAIAEHKVLLDKDRLTVGRDKNCDICLDSEDVSRKHAAVIFKHGAVYVENISSTGQVLRGREPVEYVELAADEELLVGSFRLFWRDEAVPTLAPAPAKVQASEDLGDMPALSDAPDAMLEASPPAPAENPAEAAPDAAPDFMLDGAPPPAQDMAMGVPIPATTNDAPADGLALSDGQMVDPSAMDLGVSNQYPVNAPGGDATMAFATDGATRVSEQGLSATLKLLRGEEEAREIRLGTDKDEWVVGRGSKCDIPIDNTKLSRTHFKIVREGRIFKIVDLESAAGTLLNGISVKESTLSSFDTIKIGPIEMQFIVGEVQAPLETGSRLLNGDGPLMLSGGDPADMRLEGSAPPQMDKTAFAAPVPYSPSGFQGSTSPGQNFGYTPGATQFNIPNPNSGFQSGASNQRPELPPTALEKLKAWVNTLSSVQKGIYSVLVALLIAGIALKFLGSTDEAGPAPTLADRDIASVPPAKDGTPVVESKPVVIDPNNAAIVGDVNPKFNQLAPDKRAAIEDSYAKAERAYQAKNWNDAYKFSKEVLDQVDPYKKANEILYESQLQKNNNMLGNVSTSLNNVNDAAKENAEKLDILVEAGEKALGEARWDDAEENFLRAVTLDPNNQRAQQGFVRARAKDTSVSVNLPDSQIQQDPLAEERQRITDDFSSLRKVFTDSRQKILQGNYGAAIQTLKQLDYTLREKSAEFKDTRAPASIRDFGSDQTVNLQIQVREALDNAKTQLEIVYQTQLADAEAFASNKQYVQAKEIYNKILKLEPEFDKVKVERSKLYSKILSEAKEKYQESLIYETVGDIDQAVEGFEQTRDLLQDVDEVAASDYFKKAQLKIRRLKR